MNVASMCNFAKTMSDSVFSGPLPNLTIDDMFSRHSSIAGCLDGVQPVPN